MADDIVKEFLVESYENLDQLDRDLMALEETPDDRERLSSVFRTIHTIKGTSGFLAYPTLEHVAHVGENLLVKLRDGVLRLNAVMTSGLLEMVDAVRSILGRIDSTGAEGEENYEELVAKLERLKSGETSESQAAASATAAPSSPIVKQLATPAASVPVDFGKPVDQVEIEVEQVIRELSGEVTAAVSVSNASAQKRRGRPPGSKSKSRHSDAPKQNTPDPSAFADITVLNAEAATSSASAPPPVKTPTQGLTPVLPEAAAAETHDNNNADPVTHSESPGINPIKQQKKPAADGSQNADGGDRNNSAADSTVRIDVNVLDRLMNLVGELVLARNQIMQFSQSVEDAGLVAASQRLNLITTELQEGVMKTRMQPIRNAWSKLPRVVRDLSISCGKQVQVEMEGAETELDKTILEAIRDPLTHIVRNSVDHGIEPADVRIKAGKPVQGTLWLRAYHEGGQVNIEIADDGAGIGVDRVRAKAVEKGMITSEQAAAMSDREAIQMILLPGFSTAAKVTNVSGRGVGMDVVKTNVEKIGGTLEIHSVVGKGTMLRIKIPLTLAIIPALIVTTGGDRYAIPQVSLLELVRLEGEQVRKGIEYVHGAPVYRLRGKLLPLVYLGQALNTGGHAFDGNDAVNIVVLRANDRQYGLVVDKVNDTAEIVVKPLSRQLKGLNEFAGTTIMGDGTVALILDVMGLAVAAGLTADIKDQQHAHANTSGSNADAQAQSFLVVDLGDTRRFALPTSMVARLEKVPTSSLELTNGREVIQYRGELLPIVRLTNIFGSLSHSIKESDELQIIVYSEDQRSCGFAVNRIVDIVQTELRLHTTAGEHENLLGTAVIQQRVTDVLNLKNLALQGA